jgi:hypothetical protein
LKLTVTVARAEDSSISAFKLQGLPTTLLIGKDSTLHDFQQEFDPQAIAQIPALVQALLENKALYARALGLYEEERRAYEERLVVAKTGKIPAAAVAARTAPKRHRLASLWKSNEVANVGNLLAVAPTGADAAQANSLLFAIESFRGVAELDRAGKVIARHKLNLPEGYAITMIRSGQGKDGKRYFACSMQRSPKVFVFNDAWKSTCEYPSGPVADNEDNPQVGDVELSDIDGDGEVDILVGYLGVHGLHCFSPNGEPRFRCRSLSAISRIAVTEPDRQGRRSIYGATLGGPVVLVDWRGQEKGRWTSPLGPLPFLGRLPATGDAQPPANSSELFAIAMPKPGSYAAVGIDATGAAAWEYPLPDGRHPTVIEPVTSGQLVGDAPHWIIEGPDGSIHLLGGDGTVLEQFNLGMALTGIAAGNIGGKPALIVSSAEGIEAFRLESVESVPQGEPAAGDLQR